MGVIPADQWTLVVELLELFQGFEQVMLILEADRFGPISEVWKGYMFLCRLKSDGAE